MIRTIVNTLWKHFVGMTSGVNGQPSINRNMAWGMTTLLLFVEVYSLIIFPRSTDSQLKMFCTQCIVYVVADIAFVLLVLRITSVEKLTELAQKAGDMVHRSSPSPQIPPLPPELPTKVSVSTEVETAIENNNQ